MSAINSAVLSELLAGCLQKNRRSQEQLYKMFYGYAMSVCLRYVQDRNDALEVMQDGFFKVFTKIDTFDAGRPFKTWLCRIMINCALDHYRRRNQKFNTDTIEGKDAAVEEMALSEMSYAEILELVNRLSPVYRVVFCMAVIDGYSHEEIAEKLQISVGTSKSNLSRAREKLKIMLSKINSDDYARMAR
ncbi:RNA polymerase sigma factor [Ravibacter arvi]